MADKKRPFNVVGGTDKFQKKEQESLLKPEPAYLVQIVHKAGAVEQFWTYKVDVMVDENKLIEFQYENISSEFGIMFIDLDSIASVSVLLKVDNAKEAADIIGFNMGNDE